MPRSTYMATLADIEEEFDGDYTESSTEIGKSVDKNRLRLCCSQFVCQVKKRKKLLALLLYLAYFLYAVLRCHVVDCPVEDKDRWTLILLTCVFSGVLIFYYLFIKLCWPVVRRTIALRFTCSPLPQTTVDYLRWSIFGVLFLAYLMFILIDAFVVRQDPSCLIALAGIFLLLALGVASSTSYRRIQPIRLQPIVVGLFLQFSLGVLILRCPIGETFFKWLARVATRFFESSRVGATFVWATAFGSKDLVFSVFPIIPFFAAFISLLMYFGLLQSLTTIVAIIMGKLMGTTVGESVTCCANVFVGMAESPLLVHRFLPYMTKSELHAVMTGGFATIAVYMMGSLTELGIEFKYLLAASLMAGPGALALSKLVLPEIEQSTIRVQDIAMYSESHTLRPKSPIEAIYDGARLSISMVAQIVVNLIAFVSIKSLVNGLLSWFGERAGLGVASIGEPFNLEYISSYLFWPIAFLIGVPYDDCMAVAWLLGTKFFANDPLIPFAKMAGMLNSRNAYEKYYCSYVFTVGNYSMEPILLRNGAFHLPATNVTIGPILSRKAESIATHALCGYANMAAVGIQVGAIAALAPSTRSTLGTLALRALVTATAVNLMNAATAGLLVSYSPTSWNETCLLN